jgi:hypothetical protein
MLITVTSVFKRKNQIMIVGIDGTLGSGKTLIMTYYVLLHHLRGYNVLANYHLAYPHQLIRSVDEFIEFLPEKGKKYCVAIDEVLEYMDSRSGGSKKNQVISKLALSARKTNMTIYYTQQVHTIADKRLRLITNVWIKPRFDKESQTITAEIVDQDGNTGRFKFDATPIFNLYDTNEIIQDEESEFNIRGRYNAKYLRLARQYVVKGKNKEENERALFLNGFDNVKLNNLLLRTL